MADYIYYVNPDSAASGNGTTDTLSGGNHAYQTLNAAMTARAGTHGSGNTITYRCSGNGSNWIDSTAVSTAGHTEDAVIIEGFNGNYVGRNTGSAYDNTTCYALECSTSGTHTLQMAVDNITIRYLQIDNLNGSSYYNTIHHSSNFSGATIDSCRVKATKTSSSVIGAPLWWAYYVDDGLIINNTFEGNGNTSIYNVVRVGSGGSSTPVICANNSLYALGTGFHMEQYYYFEFYNNVIAACNDDWNIPGSTNVTASNNADSADGDTPGSSNQTLSTTLTDDLTDPANGDLTPVSSGVLVDNGTSGGSIPTDDINDTARGASYDIGAFEYVSSGTLFDASAGSFTKANQSATINADRTIASDAGAFTKADQSATVAADRTVSGSAGAYTKTDQAATVAADRTVNASAGAFTKTDQGATVSADRTVNADAGAFTLSAQNATISTSVDVAFTAGAGAFTKTDQNAVVSADRTINANAASFSLAAQNASITTSSFPKVTATSTGSGSVSGAFAVSVPGGSAASGDLLVVAVSVDGTAVTISSSDITQITQDAGSSSKLYVGYRVCTGSEGSTVSLSTDANEAYAYVAYKISAATWHGTEVPDAGTAATGTSDSPNPPSVTAGWGSTDNTYIAVCGSDDGRQTVSSGVSGYDNCQSANATGPAGVSAGMCSDESASASLDPGVFTLSGSVDWVAQTIVVRPVIGGTTTVNADAAAFTQANQSATVNADRTVAADAGAFSKADQNATVSADRTVNADAGAFTKADQSATVDADRTVSADAGGFTKADQSATVSADRTVNADAGAFTLTGQGATINTGGDTAFTASAASFTKSEQNATVAADRTVSGSAGAYTKADQAATVAADRAVNASAGAFTKADQAATVIVGGLTVVNADAVSFSLTSHGAVVNADRTVNAQAYRYRRQTGLQTVETSCQFLELKFTDIHGDPLVGATAKLLDGTRASATRILDANGAARFCVINRRLGVYRLVVIDGTTIVFDAPLRIQYNADLLEYVA